MRMNKSLAVVSSDWEDFGEKKTKGNNIIIITKNIPIRLDNHIFPCYTETVARVCVQAFSTSGRCYCYGFTHTE